MPAVPVRLSGTAARPQALDNCANATSGAKMAWVARDIKADSPNVACNCWGTGAVVYWFLQQVCRSHAMRVAQHTCPGKHTAVVRPVPYDNLATITIGPDTCNLSPNPSVQPGCAAHQRQVPWACARLLNYKPVSGHIHDHTPGTSSTPTNSQPITAASVPRACSIRPYHTPADETLRHCVRRCA